MSETASAKEMDDRARFRPSDSEIQGYWNGILARGNITYSDSLVIRDEWIEDETTRRQIEACYADGFPFPLGKR